jgi:omega-amidase
MVSKLRIALIQSDTVWHDRAANLVKLRRLVATAADGGARVIALPEMFSSGFTMSAREFA